MVGGLWENSGDRDIKARAAGESLGLGCPRTASQLCRQGLTPSEGGILHLPEHCPEPRVGPAVEMGHLTAPPPTWDPGVLKGSEYFVSLGIMPCRQPHELTSATLELPHCGRGMCWIQILIEQLTSYVIIGNFF